ncbi:MAG: hypothetical protein AB4206_13065 [Xenococcaceae cyanobacterium]
MNNQKTATTSSAISNLVNAKNHHHLRENILSVGDWVCNGSSRPGEIVEIVELKAGYPKVWVKWSGDNQTNPEDPEGLTLIDPKDLIWTLVEGKLIRPRRSPQKENFYLLNLRVITDLLCLNCHSS